jgi:hypothetical protein
MDILKDNLKNENRSSVIFFLHPIVLIWVHPTLKTTFHYYCLVKDFFKGICLLTISSHKGNANQNHTKILPHLC